MLFREFTPERGAQRHKRDSIGDVPQGPNARRARGADASYDRVRDLQNETTAMESGAAASKERVEFVLSEREVIALIAKCVFVSFS
ncbi:hypothetical protein EVAR_52768_1 [Eumeta japonica]|uniref:Uncharacterized protein n=1 Tax=Eumeta variegata TaxID=151549 RepID=A0A4C1XG51_EUMVA|nr:hypothetical protein EVAR_52768_1 [Eumeta japonica]